MKSARAGNQAYQTRQAGAERTRDAAIGPRRGFFANCQSRYSKTFTTRCTPLVVAAT
jgi:hypothetical protein